MENIKNASSIESHEIAFHIQNPSFELYNLLLIFNFEP